MENLLYNTFISLLPSRKKTTPSGWISFCGPCCVHNGERQDKRSRAGVKTSGDGSFSYHCFNCGYKAYWRPGFDLSPRIIKLFRWFGVDDDTIMKIKIQVSVLLDNEQMYNYKNKKTIFTEKFSPENSKTLNYWIENPGDHEKEITKVLEYVVERGIEDHLGELQWCPDEAQNLNKRLIFPFYHNKKPVGYTARAINDSAKPKYLSSSQSGYVYNIDKQIKEYNRKVVIVTEGPFDALKIDGVATLTNRINETQADIINSLERTVIVVPDQDNAGNHVIEDVLEYDWGVAFPDWDDGVKDISDAVDKYGKLYTLWSIISSVETNKNIINVKSVTQNGS